MKTFYTWCNEALNQENILYLIKSSHYTYYSGHEDPVMAFFSEDEAKKAKEHLLHNEMSYTINPITIIGPVHNYIWEKSERHDPNANLTASSPISGRHIYYSYTYTTDPQENKGIPVFHTVEDAQKGISSWSDWHRDQERRKIGLK